MRGTWSFLQGLKAGVDSVHHGWWWLIIVDNDKQWLLQKLLYSNGDVAILIILTQLLIGYYWKILPNTTKVKGILITQSTETYQSYSEFTSSVIISAAGREVHELNDWMVAGEVIKLNGGYAWVAVGILR